MKVLHRPVLPLKGRNTISLIMTQTSMLLVPMKKNDPSRVEVGTYTELELFATDHERHAAAMICEAIASPYVEKAAELNSPSDIASSARVHITKVCCDIYVYFGFILYFGCLLLLFL